MSSTARSRSLRNYLLTIGEPVVAEAAAMELPGIFLPPIGLTISLCSEEDHITTSFTCGDCFMARRSKPLETLEDLEEFLEQRCECRRTAAG